MAMLNNQRVLFFYGIEWDMVGPNGIQLDVKCFLFSNQHKPSISNENEPQELWFPDDLW